MILVKMYKKMKKKKTKLYTYVKILPNDDRFCLEYFVACGCHLQYLPGIKANIKPSKFYSKSKKSKNFFAFAIAALLPILHA